MTETTPGSGDQLLDGRYRLGERLGGGAVADVFRGVDERLQRPVAVKVFRGDAAEELQRHESEMRTLARLDHPSLVAVFDAGHDPDSDRPYLVMQLVEGSTLAAALRDGPLGPDRTAQYGAALADALAYVHGQGFVHRDVKPANVLIAPDDRVHLADFGIARLVDSAHVTATGDVLGTPAYFAPEQVAGDPVGAPADVYALGLVLLECLTGERAFTGTAMEVAMARLSRDPAIPETVPGPWRILLARMTERDAGRRLTAAEAAADLRRLRAGGEPTVAMAAIPPAGPASAASPHETQVLPATAVVTQAVPAGAAATAATTYVEPARRRSGPAPALVALVLLIAVAVAVAVALVLTRDGGGGDQEFRPGTPTIQDGQLEDDVQRLERSVLP